MILISKNIPFIHTPAITDQSGKYMYVIVSRTLNFIPKTLANVWRPNFEDPSFFKKLFNPLPNLSDSNRIIGRDWRGSSPK